MPPPSPPAAAGRLPGNLDQALFLIAALAFCSLSSLALLTDYMGSDLAAGHLADWAITGLAYCGAAVSWYLASQRAPVGLILPLALLGIVLITLETAVTGGTHSHLYVLYVVPVIFTAALLELRLTALTKGGDKPVIKYNFPGGKDASVITGLAVRDGLLPTA